MNGSSPLYRYANRNPEYDRLGELSCEALSKIIEPGSGNLNCICDFSSGGSGGSTLLEGVITLHPSWHSFVGTHHYT